MQTRMGLDAYRALFGRGPVGDQERLLTVRGL
jgi:hypothetical protein